MNKSTSLLKDEVWSRQVVALAGDVADVLRIPECSREAITEVVYDTARDLLSSRFDDFFPVTRQATPGATYHVTMSFLADKFRLNLTEAANKRLIGH